MTLKNLVEEYLSRRPLRAFENTYLNLSRDKHPHIVAALSRRTGKTNLIAQRVIDIGRMNRNHNIVVIGQSATGCIELSRRVYSLASRNLIAARQESAARYITLENGSTVEFMTPQMNPRHIPHDLLIDDAEVMDRGDADRISTMMDTAQSHFVVGELNRRDARYNFIKVLMETRSETTWHKYDLSLDISQLERSPIRYTEGVLTRPTYLGVDMNDRVITASSITARMPSQSIAGTIEDLRRNQEDVARRIRELEQRLAELMHMQN